MTRTAVHQAECRWVPYEAGKVFPGGGRGCDTRVPDLPGEQFRTHTVSGAQGLHSARTSLSHPCCLALSKSCRRTFLALASRGDNLGMFRKPVIRDSRVRRCGPIDHTTTYRVKPLRIRTAPTRRAVGDGVVDESLRVRQAHACGTLSDAIRTPPDKPGMITIPMVFPL